MKKALGWSLVVVSLSFASTPAQQAPQIWTGRISDSMCGAVHQFKNGASSDRECVFECLKLLAGYVFVDQDHKAYAIANQTFVGLPAYADRAARLTAERSGDALVLSKIEPIPPHLHIGHVMTNWRDTPGNVGFLFAALSDAKVAADHAKLAGRDLGDLADLKLHAGNVLNALDPSLARQGPGSGYGVRKAAAGALQHIELAAKAEGASVNVQGQAAHVSASLGNVVKWTDEAVGVAQKILAADSAAAASSLANALAVLTSQIAAGVDADKNGQVGWQAGEGGLAQAQAEMDIMMRGEGLERSAI